MRVWTWNTTGFGIPLDDQGVSLFGPPPHAISGNGTRFVGIRVVGGALQGYRWNSGGDLDDLGASIPSAISADGQRVVGSVLNGPNARAAVWTLSDGWTQLATPVIASGSSAHAITADGGGAAGLVTGVSGSAATLARWNGSNYTELASVPFTGTSSHWSMSDSGSIIVGTGMVGSTSTAFRYSDSMGYQILAGLIGSSTSQVNSLSGDGSIAGGFSNIDASGDRRGVLWLGMSTTPIDITTYLFGFGINLEGWRLTSVIGISGDGLTFAGNGIDPRGMSSPWIATIPAPGPAGAMLLGTLIFGRRRRKA